MKNKKNKPPTSATNPTSTASANPSNESNSVKTSEAGYRSPVFAQYFSFVLLLLAIVLVSVLFYEVMVAFWIPLFLAAVLVVVFRPWYNSIRTHFKLGNTISALLTTASVLLIFLIPLGAILALAAIESQQVLRQFNSTQALENAKQIRSKLGLELPLAVSQTRAEFEILSSDSSLDTFTENRHQASLFEIERSADELADFYKLDPPKSTVMPNSSDPSSAEKSEPNNDGNTSATWQNYLDKLAAINQLHESIDWDHERGASDIETPDLRQQRLASFHNYKLQVDELEVAFGDFITHQLGGKTKAWAATFLNPTEEQSEIYVSKVTNQLRDTLFVFGSKGLTYFLFIVGGSVVMIISFYFFLLDGHAMINTFKRLSPLDDEHEQKLVDQFSKVSRAVVVATLLSALVQGLLAGIGFYFADLESIFLLTVLSAVLAMVPFLGAASVWIPCALYLYFIENNMPAAIGLALYGAAVISMADNIIKPLVLHGQSKLHPLFAFLSVIGGLAMLGPIGILIGPMIVAFFQTLLEILHSEVRELDKNSPLSSDNTA